VKKILVFILAFAYVTSSSGATIFVQQCMGKTVSWSLSEKASNKCSKCGMHKNAPNDCCKGHVKVLKVHNDQNLPEGYFNKISLSAAFLPAQLYKHQKFYFIILSLKDVKDHRPPPRNDYRILYCSFLI
jgi:uncharacterized membrane protein